ncbi:DUF4439 domain-containing protein [Nocardioides sp.]|jgi:hypothetical protein|uniref:DUF4439 domain-containing protein n=1 Tax=Nocardioides sp. TaxID=35761 RepID=UPI002BDF32E2|nr:DUF4439 domain-containing protein [Nocardioides sp.]HVX54961.1 DUF4439 domain-containing protein [Nocardioides sp.]
MSTSPQAALRAALASEHGAVYLFAALRSRTAPGALADALRTAYDFHRATRDLLADRLAELGDPAPPGAAPAYTLPGGLDTAAGVTAAALVAEQTAAIGYGDLVARTTGSDRSRAIAWLADTAVRELSFGGRPTTLPGIDPK